LCAACGSTPAQNLGDTAGCTRVFTPAENIQTAAQTTFINAAAGSTLCFAPGTYRFTEELTLSTPNITLRGTAPGVVWDFSGQRSGRQAMLVTGNGFTVDRVEVKNTRGDGIRVQGTQGVTFRRVKASWDAGSVTSNGKYAIFPVNASRVLIEDCEVVGASDAGIYVGQSSQIIVRRNYAHGNVAGIEIENSSDAEVYDNRATDNTGGILVFNLPNLMVRDGRRTLVHDNVVEGNNRANFAEVGNIVREIPAGTGMVILAADQIEYRNNTIRRNNSTGVLVISYLVVNPNWRMSREFDLLYDVYPQTLWVHDNTFEGNGSNPQGALEPFRLGDMPVADIVWDGHTDTTRMGMGSELSLCITNNGAARFFNADFPHNFTMTSTDLSRHNCMQPPIARVTF
jgi:parallel beta-helix repeat protein